MFFDNFFTSLFLLNELKERFRATDGTLRQNRIEKFPLIPVKEMEKRKRATYYYSFGAQNELLLVHYSDELRHC